MWDNSFFLLPSKFLSVIEQQTVWWLSAKIEVKFSLSSEVQSAVFYVFKSFDQKLVAITQQWQFWKLHQNALNLLSFSYDLLYYCDLFNSFDLLLLRLTCSPLINCFALFLTVLFTLLVVEWLTATFFVVGVFLDLIFRLEIEVSNFPALCACCFWTLFPAKPSDFNSRSFWRGLRAIALTTEAISLLSSPLVIARVPFAVTHVAQVHPRRWEERRWGARPLCRSERWTLVRFLDLALRDFDWSTLATVQSILCSPAEERWLYLCARAESVGAGFSHWFEIWTVPLLLSRNLSHRTVPSWPISALGP